MGGCRSDSEYVTLQALLYNFTEQKTKRTKYDIGHKKACFFKKLLKALYSSNDFHYNI